MCAVGVCISLSQAVWQEGVVPTRLPLHWHAHQGKLEHYPAVHMGAVCLKALLMLMSIM